jgi:hypothetical protein
MYLTFSYQDLLKSNRNGAVIFLPLSYAINIVVPFYLTPCNEKEPCTDTVTRNEP